MLQLLENLFGEALSPERRGVVFTTPSRQTRLFADYQRLADYASEQSRTQNVYFGLGLIAGRPQGRGKLADIAGIGGLWCDIDVASDAHPKANLPQTIDEARGLLGEMPLSPSAVVHSGHGLHAYWLLHEPWLFTDDAERQKAAELAKGWHGLLCRKAAARGWALENLGDLTRVLRLPGTLNHNGGGQPVEVRLLKLEENCRYGPDDFEPYLPAEQEPVASAECGELVLRPDAEPPALRLLHTASKSPLFWQTWNRQRTDLADQSASGYDLSLATLAALNEWNDQEIANLLIAFRRHHNDNPEKALRLDYLRRTIAKARQAQPNGEPVDLSGIIGPSDPSPPAEPTVPDPGPMPEGLLRVPGFVGEVMGFCLSAARYPNLPLAFCGAMALQSFLASRKVREPGGLRPNLYLLALADSGSGKAYPRKINSYVLSRVEMGGMVGNQIASGQGLEDEMLVHRKMLYQTDEVDHLLRCIASPKESYYSMLLAMLLQLYTEADEVHVARARARDRNRKPEPRGEVDQPGLVIFGTATPECFLKPSARNS